MNETGEGYNGAFTGPQIDEAIGKALGSGARTVSFTSSQWSGGALRIQAANHGMQSDTFGFVLRHLVSGVLKSGTWAAMGTGVSYEAASGDVVLTSDAPYDGSITFIS